ncbi:MAG: DUF4293 family protein [Bacteroidetes bacterium]|nr:DUF4293 family protein [Bacteroidota bacterium]
MIQRIQTLFLLLSIVCLGLFLWLPEFGVEGTNYKDMVPGWNVGHTLHFQDEAYIYFFNLIFTCTAIWFALVNVFLFPLTEKSNGILYIITRLLVPIAGWILFVFRLFNPEYEFSSSRIRSQQMLFCWFSILFIVCAEGFVYFKYQTKIFLGDVILTPWNILTIVAVVLQILAFIYIRKDEELLKSVDRLRD